MNFPGGVPVRPHFTHNIKKSSMATAGIRIMWFFLLLRTAVGLYRKQVGLSLGATRLQSLSSAMKLRAPLHSQSPLDSLQKGTWVKLICGASNQDVPLIRNLCFLYTIAGVDCIDLSANVAVLAAAKAGVDAALQHGIEMTHRPYLMVSINADEDMHFRKAYFDPSRCPPDCSRPCQRVCPAWAIPSVSGLSPSQQSGVLEEKCYGCGRCISICPLGLIEAQSYASNAQDVSLLLSTGSVDGLEIHTGPSHISALSALWNDIAPAACGNLKVLSVSFPKVGDRTNAFLGEVNSVLTRHSSWPAFQGVQVWQADGRPMSGDIGKGTAHAAASLAAGVLQHPSTTGQADTVNAGADSASVDFSSGKHFVQLAGGTNDYSITCAAQQGLTGLTGFGGYAFGGYARKYIDGYLNELERAHPAALIENHPEVMQPCLDFARQLVGKVKGAIQ